MDQNLKLLEILEITLMIFIDTSVYLSALIPNDPNCKKATSLFEEVYESKDSVITSYGVLGEILTVSSLRYNKAEGIKYVEEILQSQTKIVLEDIALVQKAFAIFQSIKSKNVSWMDCYSFAIIERFKVEKALSFDQDFRKYAKTKILS